MSPSGPQVVPSSVAPERYARCLAACCWLTLAQFVLFLPFAGYGYSQHGNWGIAAAGFASLVCWIGAILALVVAGIFSLQNGVGGALGGMIFRMGVPLAGMAFLVQYGGPLTQAGAPGMVAACYLITLPLETLLLLRLAATSNVAPLHEIPNPQAK